MPKEIPNLSIAELEKLLDTKRNSVVSLAKRREDLVEQIAELDRQIQHMANLRGIAGPLPRKRAKNASSLRAVLLDLLQKNKKGLKLADLAEKVKETGYVSHSKNFSNVVYQTLYHSSVIELDEITGCYRLKKDV